ncbi:MULTISPECIES: nucleotidyltransferase domain-containing protein [unclassified Caballeronia]|uniref:nucleotidyltransferase domain-containing protein n=1 Tax=unclassified Caballeronia TaxID=2646786 RepID=UPI00202905FA|nr:MULTISPECIES: nucleotidyltransferase domain-containing protein [unclassified Caballeronia]
MRKHFYAFGSICRGEMDRGSDIDLLACTDERQPVIDPQKFSIYTYDRLEALWREGNPFAWHLHYESALIFSSDGIDFLKQLGEPSEYQKALQDCAKFKRLFDESANAFVYSRNSQTFHLSCMFLAIRNFSTCYSFLLGKPIFSRNSPMLVSPAAPLEREQFEIFAKARILSTRGYGQRLNECELEDARKSLDNIRDWMKSFNVSI